MKYRIRYLNGRIDDGYKDIYDAVQAAKKAFPDGCVHDEYLWGPFCLSDLQPRPVGNDSPEDDGRIRIWRDEDAYDEDAPEGAYPDAVVELLYKCCDPDCPGYTYKASERRHPCGREG